MLGPMTPIISIECLASSAGEVINYVKNSGIEEAIITLNHHSFSMFARH